MRKPRNNWHKWDRFTGVEIEWLDSVRETTGWRFLSTYYTEEDQLRHKSTGYLLEVTSTFVAICQSINLSQDDPTIEGIFRIPIVSITSMVRIN